jgi:hypothetical protein
MLILSFDCRNGRYFEPILNYLRTGQLIYDKNMNPEGIQIEAKFFGLEELVLELTPIVNRNAGYLSSEDNAPLTRQDVVRYFNNHSYPFYQFKITLFRSEP